MVACNFPPTLTTPSTPPKDPPVGDEDSGWINDKSSSCGVVMMISRGLYVETCVVAKSDVVVGTKNAGANWNARFKNKPKGDCCFRELTPVAT